MPARGASAPSASSLDPYDAPADCVEIDQALRGAWNRVIERDYGLVKGDFPAAVADAGRFVAPAPMPGREVPLRWLPVPRQVVGCTGRTRARLLCDAPGPRVPADGPPPLGLAGGREWHNEYCEYRVLRRKDRDGRLRAKRVEITTELREYWLCLAVERPALVLEMAREVLEDGAVRYEDLYGCDPTPLSREERERAFVEWTAGSALSNGRVAPRGPCNRERALFMCHPINGLDDLFFITMFGAQPFARVVRGRVVPVELMSVFADTPWFEGEADRSKMRDTFCRHADPAATAVAYAAAFTGRRVAVANPPAVFMSPVDFDVAALTHRSGPVPEAWVRWRRQVAPGRYQRLEVGPSDDEESFLDDIHVRRGAQAVPLSGGFQLLELLSVGLQLVTDTEPVRRLAPEDYLVLEPAAPVIRCGSRESGVCSALTDWLPGLEDPGAPPAPVPLWYRRQLLRPAVADGPST